MRTPLTALPKIGDRVFVQYEESEGTVTEYENGGGIVVRMDSDGIEVGCSFSQLFEV